MKKVWIGIASVLFCCSLALTACGGNGEGPDDGSKDPVYTISLSESTLSLELTHTSSLTATVYADGKVVDAAAEWSSSNDGVVSVSGGAVTAMGTGSATITAAYQGASATCSVSVSASYLPSLQIGVGMAENLAVLLDGEYQLVPYVVYDGSRFDDGSFTYTSGDEEIVSVSDSGVLVGASVGSTTVTIEGAWRGFGSDVLSAVYPVSVARDFSVSIGSPEITTIASAAVDLEGYDVPNTVQLTATVRSGGSVLDDPSLEWTTSDESVATVVNGLVTGHKAGTVAIGVTYTDDEGASYAAVPVTITVEFPFVDRSDSIHLGELDASDAYDASADGLVISKTRVFGENAQDIVAVYDVTGGGRIAFNVETDQNGNGVIRESGSVAMTARDRVWEIHSANYAYRVSVYIITRVIHNAQDLMTCFNIQTTGSNNQVFYGDGAYYVLGENIDAHGTVRLEDNWTNSFTASGGSGFQGEFDGRGYTIDGLTLQNGGLFGNLTTGAIVKNFALTNVTLTRTAARADYEPAALAYSIYGDATIENVFIQITGFAADMDTAYNAGTGPRGITNMVRGASGGTAPTIKNVVLYMDLGQALAAGAAASLLTRQQASNYARFENVHVISDYKLLSASYGGDTPEAAFVSVTRYGLTSNTFASQFSSVEEVGLSSDLWTYDASIGYPVFTSYYNEFRTGSVQKAFDALPDTLTLEAGAAYTVPAACGEVILSKTGSDEAITIDGRTLRIGVAAQSGSFTLTVTSTIDGNITKDITITVQSAADLERAETLAAFSALNGKVYEFNAGAAASWTIADANVDGVDTARFGEVTLTLSGDALSGVTVDDKTVVIAATAAAGDAIVTVSSVQYAEISAEITIRILTETVTTDALVELSKDADDSDNHVLDYSALDDLNTAVGILVSYRVKNGASYVAVEEGSVTFGAGKVTLSTQFLAGLATTGAYEFRVQVPGTLVEFTNVMLYTDIIMDAEELMKAFGSNLTTSSSDVKLYGAGTYYVLGGDIDASETVRGEDYWTSTTNNGFQGIFDGKGHTIDGLTVANGGLFGNLASGSSVKNFALTNVTLSAPRGWQPSPLAYYIYGNAKVENVFMHVTQVTESGAASGNLRGLANLVRGVNTSDYPTIRNVVLYMNFSVALTNAATSLVSNYNYGNYAVFQNMHVISNYTLTTAGDSTTPALSGITRYGTNASYASFAARYANADTALSDAGLSAEYWTYDASIGYPVFRSYYENFRTSAIRAAFNALPDTLNLDAGSSWSVPAACGDVTLSENSGDSAISATGRVLSIGASAESATFTLTVTSEIDGFITKDISVTVRGAAELAKAAVQEAFGRLDGKTYEFNAGEGGSWSIENANVDGVDASVFGEVSLEIAGSHDGVTLSGTNITVSADAEAGEVSVTVRSVTYSDISATIVIRVLNSSITVDTLTELSQDEDDNHVLDYSETLGVETATGISVSYRAASGGDYLPISADSVEFSAGYVTLKPSFLASIAVGEYEFRVQVAGAMIEFTSVMLYTDIVMDAAELMEAFGSHLAKNSSDTTAFYGAGTYYVLGANINATGTTRGEDNWTNDLRTNNDNRGIGFAGIFDGRGYTIDGLTLQNGGLFGNLAAGSVVKNFALTNLTLTSARADYQPAALAYFVYGDALIENVFVHITSCTMTLTGNGGARGLVNQAKANNTADNPMFRNVVVFMDLGDTAATSQPASLLSEYNYGNYAKFTNVHVISDYTLSRADKGGDNPVSGSTSIPFSGTITRYGLTANTFAEKVGSIESAGLSADYWEYDAGVGYPVFKTSASYLA